MKRLTFGAALAVTILLITGCFAPASTAPPVTPTPTPTPMPTSTPVCEADTVLRQVEALLAGQTFEAHYLTINRELTLSLWLVDPALDPTATESDLAQNNRQAFGRGLAVSHQIATQIPCARKVFENVNPMIVDRHYQSWYLDIIPFSAFPAMENPSQSQLVTAIQRSGAEFASRRRSAPSATVYPPAPPNACTWPQARAAIQQRFGPERRNTAAYLLIGDPPAVQAPWNSYATTSVVVQVQWDVRTPGETDDAAVLQNIEHLAAALACLSPPVDRLEVYVVDDTGQLVVYGLVPGTLIRERVSPLPEDSVLLHHVFLME